MGPYIPRTRQRLIAAGGRVNQHTPIDVVVRLIAPLTFCGSGSPIFEANQRRGAETGILRELDGDGCALIEWENSNRSYWYDSDCFEVVG